MNSCSPERDSRVAAGRLAVVAALAAGVALAIVAVRLVVTGRRAARWNVVLITLDTTRADRIGCYGARGAATPVIDWLSRDGVRYQRCYSPTPLTQPSHTSILTGLVPLRHGIHDNGPDALAPEAETLAEILRRHGYDTAAVVGSFVLDRQFGLDQGFDHYDDDLAQGAPGGLFRYAERNAEQVTDAALAWLGQRRHKPVFLWVHYFDPHSPYAPPGFNPTFSTQTGYDAEIAYVDSQLDRLIDQLDQQTGRPALVVLTADHGEGRGEHGEPTHGLFLYDATMRVPLIVRFPDHRHAGQVVQSPVALVDILPSILTWLGLDPPANLDGVPLAVTEPPQPAPAPRAIYLENRSVANSYGWSPLTAIVLGADKFIQAPRPEWYHLPDDPHEQHNLFDADDDRCRKLADRLAGLGAELSGKRSLRGRAAQLNDTDLEKLGALGYLAAGAAEETAATGPARVLPNALDPKDMVDIYNQIQDATLLIERDQIDKAVAALVAIVESADPANRRAVRLLAMLSAEKRAVRQTIIQCLQRIARGPNGAVLDPFALGRLGVGQMDFERYAEAIETFGRLVQLEPKHALAYRYLGDAYRKTDRPKEAVRAYRRAVELTSGLAPPPDWLDQVQAHLRLLAAP